MSRKTKKTETKPNSPANPTSVELRHKLDTLLMGGYGPLPMESMAQATSGAASPNPLDPEVLLGRPLTETDKALLDLVGGL